MMEDYDRDLNDLREERAMSRTASRAALSELPGFGLDNSGRSDAHAARKSRISTVCPGSPAPPPCLAPRGARRGRSKKTGCQVSSGEEARGSKRGETGDEKRTQ